jgi:hypothetical protein
MRRSASACMSSWKKCSTTRAGRSLARRFIRTAQLACLLADLNKFFLGYKAHQLDIVESARGDATVETADAAL